jgi:hypothetical protein
MARSQEEGASGKIKPKRQHSGHRDAKWKGPHPELCDSQTLGQAVRRIWWEYWVDAICDIVIDCWSFVPMWWREFVNRDKARTLFIIAFFSDSQKVDYPKHQQGDRNWFLKAIETHLKGSDLSRRGPYVIGNDITYPDLVLFQLLHDENFIQDGRKGCKDTRGCCSWLMRFITDPTSRSSSAVTHIWLEGTVDHMNQWKDKILNFVLSTLSGADGRSHLCDIQQSNNPAHWNQILLSGPIGHKRTSTGF